MKIHLTKTWVGERKIVFINAKPIKLSYVDYFMLLILSIARKKCLGLVVPFKYLYGENTTKYIYKLKKNIKNQSGVDFGKYIKNTKGAGYWLDCIVGFETKLLLCESFADGRVDGFIEYLKKV